MNDEFNDTFATAHESFSTSKTKHDWAYGVGYEYGFAGQWSGQPTAQAQLLGAF
ncbi:hypothetical protein [Lysobacter tyrosinilyticus]